MKANEAPEKLYLINDKDSVMLSYDPSTKLHGDRYDFVDKEVFPIEEGYEVEYTRTDAFIEKACEFISLNVADYIDVTHKGGIKRLALRERFIEKFIKHMKGE